MINKYFSWLNDGLNGLYFFITILLIGVVVLVILGIFLLIEDYIDIHRRLKKIEERNKKRK